MPHERLKQKGSKFWDSQCYMRPSFKEEELKELKTKDQRSKGIDYTLCEFWLGNMRIV